MRLIDADALGIGPCKPELFEKPGYGDGWNSAIRILQSAETVDPIRHAHWIEDEDGDGRHCSGCGHDYCYMLGDPEIFEFCPFCGAKMDEKGAVTDGEDKG